MKVTLYRYVGDSDVANKILKNCTVVYDKEVIPYGAFNPNGASFRLDTLHDVNYAKFTYNSHDYYGYVDVSTDSKGIYNYSITTDPLTTAWYAGCFNTGNLCLYSDLGTGKFFDGRATYSPDLNYEYIQVKEASTNFRVILVISRPWQDSESQGNIYNPLFDIYSMSFVDYARFCHASANAAFKDARNCIFKFYAVPTDELTSLSTRYTAVTSVELYQPTNDKMPSTSCPAGLPTWPQLTNTFKISTPAEGYTYNENWLSTFRATIDKPINSWRRQNMIKLYVEDMGYIAFKYSDVAKGGNITSIGYRKSFDFISGLQRATLIVNGEVLKDYFIQSSIANTVPYFDLEHQKSYSEQFAGMLSAGIGLTSGIMTLAGTGIAGAATDYLYNSLMTRDTTKAMKGLLKQGKIEKETFDVWKDVQEQISNTRMGTFVNAVKGTGSKGGAKIQLGAQNVVSSLNQMAANSQGVGYAVNGSGAGSLDLPNRSGSFIIWQEAPPHNLADIEGKFGKPDGLVRVIGNMTGWVQTEACHLPSNGLPFDIVTDAEQIADNGFRIVT